MAYHDTHRLSERVLVMHDATAHAARVGDKSYRDAHKWNPKKKKSYRARLLESHENNNYDYYKSRHP